MADLTARNYDADAVVDLLGPAGHIGLKVHDNDTWHPPAGRAEQRLDRER